MYNLGVTVLLLIFLILLRIALTQWASERREHEAEREEHIHQEIVYEDIMQKSEAGFNSGAGTQIISGAGNIRSAEAFGIPTIISKQN